MFKNMSIAEQLEAAQVAIDAVLNDSTLQTTLAAYGYDVETMQAGRALYEAAQRLHQAKAQAYGEQKEATDVMREARGQAHTAYMRSLKLARVAFKGDVSAQQTLALNGRRKRSLSGWTAQAQQFYDGLLTNEALLAAMGRFGYDEASVKQELGLVNEVLARNVKQEHEKGEAQKATQARDEKLDVLDDWLADFKSVSEVAFADDPQQLEKMGFGAR